MAFSITFCRPSHANAILPGVFQTSDPQHIEWITPSGWSATAAKSAFETQFPGVTVLRCDEITH